MARITIKSLQHLLALAEADRDAAVSRLEDELDTSAALRTERDALLLRVKDGHVLVKGLQSEVAALRDEREANVQRAAQQRSAASCAAPRPAPRPAPQPVVTRYVRNGVVYEKTRTGNRAVERMVGAVAAH